MSVDHTVQAGESIDSIAFDNGFFGETLWNHASNSNLKSTRKDPDILLPGDIVHIPDLREREESAASDKKHTYRRKGVPAKFVLILRKPSSKAGEKAELSGTGNPWDYEEPIAEIEPDEPDSDVPWHLYVDSVLIAEGTTDGEGKLEAKLSPGARQGILILHRGTPKERSIQLQFRHMDPVAELTGLCKRLVNLGYPCATDQTEVTPGIAAAISQFQQANDLEVTGKPDDATRDKLVSLHGG